MDTLPSPARASTAVPIQPLNMASDWNTLCRHKHESKDELMNVLITGAAGMLGRKLAARLISDERINGKPIQQITLFDIVEANTPN